MKKKKQIEFNLTVENDKLYFWTYSGDKKSVSTKIDITSAFNFLKEFFAERVRGIEVANILKPRRSSKKKKANNKLKGSTSERKNFRISNSDYKELTDAYEKYKGIILKGAEFGPVRQAIKTMLYSGRTKEDILNFMKWASKLCKEIVDDTDLERTMGWMSNWTMLTVKRKMPEFLAGKFTEEEETDPTVKKLDSLTEDDFK